METVQKVAAVLGILLMVFAAAAFIAGRVLSPVVYENEITVEKPVGTAWKIFTDAGKLGQWLHGFKAIKPIEGNPLDEGSVFRLTFEMEGGEVVVTEEVTDVEENERFAFTMESGPLNSEVDIRFESVDSATTRIHARTVAEGNGFLWKPLIGLSGERMRRQSQISYDNLERLIERVDTSSVRE